MAQETSDSVRVVKLNVYEFRYASLQASDDRSLAYNFPNELQILIDESSLKQLKLKSETKLLKLSKELKSSAKEYGREFLGERSNKAQNKWREIVEEFGDRFQKQLTASEKSKVQDIVAATEFFNQGYSEFVKSRNQDLAAHVSIDFLKGKGTQIKADFREIEKEVLDLLLEGTEKEKVVEFNFILRDPARLPSLSMLASSLQLLQDKSYRQVEEARQRYQYQVKLGQFSAYRRFPDTGNSFVYNLSIASKTSSKGKEIRRAASQYFERRLEIEDEYNEKQNAIEREIADAKEKRKTLEKLRGDELKSFQELERSTLELFEPSVRREIARVRIANDYTQNGLVAAFFGKRNKNEFEFPLDEKDHKRFAKKAQPAFEKLQELTNEWVRDVFAEALTKNLKEEKHIRWLKRGNKLGVFPLELVHFWATR